MLIELGHTSDRSRSGDKGAAENTDWRHSHGDLDRVIDV